MGGASTHCKVKRLVGSLVKKTNLYYFIISERQNNKVNFTLPKWKEAEPLSLEEKYENNGK